MIERYTNLVTVFVCASLFFVSGAHSAGGDFATVCYLPGAGGGSDYAMNQLTNDMKARGVRSLSFDLGKNETVQAKADRFRDHIERLLALEPDFKCHVVAHSQGGVVIRYAMNHEVVRHPRLGRISLADIVLSATSMDSPHRGTPLARLGQSFLGSQLQEGLRQLSEENIVIFNDPRYPDTYSPQVPGIPFYSYRSFIKSRSEAMGWGEKLGFEAIKSDLARRGLNPANDGIVPTESEGFGQVLQTMQVPHGYFTSAALPDFLMKHLNVIKSLETDFAEDFSSQLKFTPLHNLPYQLAD